MNGWDLGTPFLKLKWTLKLGHPYLLFVTYDVFLSNKEMFMVSHGQSVVLRQMSVWWNILAPILQ